MDSAPAHLPLDHPDLDRIEADVGSAVALLLHALRIAPDEHTSDTPARVARMYVREVFAGRFQPRPDITVFDNDGLDEIYAVGPIAIRSCCAHHLAPVTGQAWVALRPFEKLIGLSKFSRLAQWVFARPTIQETATQQLADEIWDATRPLGLAVLVRASHGCCTWRGIKDSDQMMTTSVMRGFFRDDAAGRAEVLSIFRGLGA